MLSKIKKWLLTTWLGRLALMPYRLVMVMQKATPGLIARVRWVVQSREIGIEGYVQEPLSQRELGFVLSVVTGKPVLEIFGYLEEIRNDHEFHDYWRSTITASPLRWSLDAGFAPGRRVQNYVIIRATRPRTVVEAGVRHGHGAALILRALERNACEGFSGHYFGVEDNRQQECLLWQNYPGPRGQLVYDDSVTFLRTWRDDPIDFFMHETHTESEHAIAQLTALKPHLHVGSIIVTPWLLKPFMDFALEDDWHVLGHHDRVSNHWHAGSHNLFLFKKEIQPSAPNN